VSGQPGGQGGGAAVALPVAVPGGEALPWLVPTVMAVLERAGGSTYRLGGEGGGVAALVTARSATDFDVVLEVTGTLLKLRVWGLERAYPLPADDPATAAAAALRALDDWMALLAGTARLVVYYRAGAACCWTVATGDDAVHMDRGWHPRTPPARLSRWLRRWRRRVLVNGFLDGDAVRLLRSRAEHGAAEHAAPRRAADRATRPSRAPVAAA
jgi:hypothetical protein